MNRYVTRVMVWLLAGLLVSCGGGGSGDSTSGGSSPDTSNGGSPPSDGGGTPPPSGGGTPPPNDGGVVLPSAGARVEESDPKVILTGAWTPSDSRYGWSGGAARQSTAAGAVASFTFTGTSVRWIGRRSTGSGIAVVKLDGGPGIEVDLYAKPFEVRTPVITLNGLTDGPHTLTIEVTGRQNPLSSSSAVVVDAFEVGPPIVSHLQETDPDVTFSAGWVHLDDGKWSGGGVRTGSDPAFGGARAAEAAGEKLTLKFRGTSISWIGYRGPGAGIARVQVDGAGPTDVDLYSPAEKIQAVVFTATGLTDATHTLTIEATGLKNDASTGSQVVVDAFDVTTPGRRYQEREWDPTITNPPIIYTGTWNDDNVNRVWSEGAAATTIEPGARATFTFTGTSVSWIGCEKASIGRADIYLDGAFVKRVNMSKTVGIEGYQRTIYRADGLTNGIHTLEIVAVSGITVVDAFDVQ